MNTLPHRLVRQTGFWGLLLALLALLASCGTQPVVTPTPLVATPTPRSTSLLFWHAWPSPEQHILAALVDRYNQAHPHTQVILQAMPLASLTSELRTATLAGSGPHMVLLHNHTLGALVEEGLLLPLDTAGEPLANPLAGNLLVGDVLDETIAAGELLTTTLEGAIVTSAAGQRRLYGLPLAFDTLVLYYDRTHFTRAPTSTAELLDTAHTLSNSTRQPPVWGLAYTLSFDKTIPYLGAFGGQVLDETGQVVLGTSGRAGTERWLGWLLDLRQDDAILATLDSITVDSAIQSQAVSATIDWAHALPAYSLLWGDQLGVATLPPLPGAPVAARTPRPYVQTDVVSINARVTDRHEQRAALDFMHYLLGAEAQRALLDIGKQPVLLSLPLSDDTPDMRAARVLRQQARNGQAMPNSRRATEIVREELQRMQMTVLRGLATPGEAVSQTDRILRDRLGNEPSRTP